MPTVPGPVRRLVPAPPPAGVPFGRRGFAMARLSRVLRKAMPDPTGSACRPTTSRPVADGHGFDRACSGTGRPTCGTAWGRLPRPPVDATCCGGRPTRTGRSRHGASSSWSGHARTQGSRPSAPRLRPI
ncbi:hypothetical protein HNR21_006664 [Actinomadura cellulosilytica]|uniref:Uncharacterized protein n=1 Tax=Thermomonospora cellulosilytica TaxID=1411118 RepID=A0A7W3N5A8_9ACTN|nr:hypothetical protein [Thermomonospora cellulosilytica]